MGFLLVPRRRRGEELGSWWQCRKGLHAAPYGHGVSARVGACTSLTRFGGLGTTLRHVPECWVLPETPVSPAQPPVVHGP